MPHFECGAFDHSATSPRSELDARVIGRSIAWGRVFHKRGEDRLADAEGFRFRL